ncbi:hypothetical protein [Kribbella antiqua]|uniref:hypothetical protein n=1 Tax=Kribbella antiqua TaxID=2512217 RepID=UPI00104FF09D|nr:hypothetical protein [Kribbella antiqua]
MSGQRGYFTRGSDGTITGVDALMLDQPALQDHGRRYHAAQPYWPARAWHPHVDDGYLHWELVELAQ